MTDRTPEDVARQEVVNGAWLMAEADENTHGQFAAGCARHDKALDAYAAAVAARVRAECEAERLVTMTLNGREVPVDAKWAFNAARAELVKVTAERDAVAARVRAECGCVTFDADADALRLAREACIDDAAYARGRADTLAEVRGIVEGMIVNRPSDPIANAFDGGMRTILDALARLTPTEGPTDV